MRALVHRSGRRPAAATPAATTRLALPPQVPSPRWARPTTTSAPAADRGDGGGGRGGGGRGRGISLADLLGRLSPSQLLDEVQAELQSYWRSLAWYEVSACVHVTCIVH